MIKSQYLHLNRIEFIITYQCTGKCMHCSLGDQLNRPAEHTHVESRAAAGAVTWLARQFPIQSVMTFGGEPLLYPETVCAVHRAATENGIGTRQLITNGYFSKDEKRIDQVAADLKAAGVNNLLLSVDAFHQQTIPVAAVHRFAEAVKRENIEKFRLQPAWVVNREHENPYNEKTRQVLADFDDLDIPVGSGNDIFMAGNAAKNLASYYQIPPLDLTQACGSMPYTGRLDDISTLSIEPNGDVTVCSFAIGNIYEQTMEEIVTCFDPYEHEGMRAVLEGGVPGLLELAKKKGIAVDCGDCFSACDVCGKICRMMRSRQK